MYTALVQIYEAILHEKAQSPELRPQLERSSLIESSKRQRSLATARFIKALIGENNNSLVFKI